MDEEPDDRDLGFMALIFELESELEALKIERDDLVDELRWYREI